MFLEENVGCDHLTNFRTMECSTISSLLKEVRTRNKDYGETCAISFKSRRAQAGKNR